jgi:hypothetical protein
MVELHSLTTGGIVASSLPERKLQCPCRDSIVTWNPYGMSRKIVSDADRVRLDSAKGQLI